jgi:hypothetical protein
MRRSVWNGKLEAAGMWALLLHALEHRGIHFYSGMVYKRGGILVIAELVITERGNY